MVVTNLYVMMVSLIKVLINGHVMSTVPVEMINIVWWHPRTIICKRVINAGIKNLHFGKAFANELGDSL
ncbi:hypothetical protein SAMN05421821_12112 [Mucilaginibacter lappiensis]|uniref:Uncharacterized protein n=1 Tax=Mucilaginibacter lappiensis TaxID=354630 RepID=A0ABR6PWJ1_9SPHI|nr:hypothetical protein [Mucilaginibacter lappiensis]SIS05609.1 hypothetical protein SAMN05421821_12112 [Mucilaginibacter lappiensis]